MLLVTQKQFSMFQVRAEHEFVQVLQKSLSKKYPDLLPCFPDKIQIKIVINMLDRAKRWGITWKSSLVIFAELMVSIAPNFDEQAEIQGVLKSDKKNINKIMRKITKLVSEDAWKKAEKESNDLPFFLEKKYINAPLIEQTIYAIPFVLWDKISAINARSFTVMSCNYTARLGLNHIADAPLTLIVWRCLYGDQFNDPTIYPWVNELMSYQHQPSKFIATLKHRIMLDHGRMV